MTLRNWSILILHPLSRALLHRKWRYYGIYVFNSIFMANIVLLCMLTHLVVSTVNYRLTPQPIRRSYENVKKHAFNTSQVDDSQCILPESNAYERDKFDLSVGVSSSSSSFFCLMAVLFVKEGKELYIKLRDHWYLRRPFSVLKTFVKVAAFTITFYKLMSTLVLPDDPLCYAQGTPLLLDMLTAHYSLMTSTVCVGLMTVGDVNTKRNFIDPLTHGLVPFLTMMYIILAIFLLKMLILLNNLLTVLAVCDIKATMENATEVCLKNQIKILLNVEKLIPRSVNQ
ncbi:hypothetical protein BV898_10274 [Hypsibius exemplaris]|uniref:Ion transport domain-containing protein n=1 Tax=Hypsibius exemplaris TaxID=2072580 RepID=A0A1W0WK57_HYPEX|nr:hypothetical protein BV898_10274 [Hypsibius exemplaris]